MRLLLDTHVFLWYIAADAHLPVPFRDAIKNVQNEMFVSAASIWEAVIKAQIGKLAFPASASPYLRGQRRQHLMESRCR
jgi:PIN domain nuclease of toxin-antitoxin system